MLQWFRRRRQAERLAQADAEALIRDHGGEAYGEARQRERDVILPDGTTHAGRTPAHWRRVALIVAKRTGRRRLMARVIAARPDCARVPYRQNARRSARRSAATVRPAAQAGA